MEVGIHEWDGSGARADALTPRDGDLNPVLGPEVQHTTGMPILSVRGRGSRWPLVPSHFVPESKLGPGSLRRPHWRHAAACSRWRDCLRYALPRPRPLRPLTTRTLIPRSP